MSFANRMKKQAVVIACALASTASMSALAKQNEQPKLVLQITVDALRGDFPTRFLDKMGKGGFRYLLEEGVVYNNAHYQHANTETIVGHSSLATGALPSVHGMVGNVWFDRKLARIVYNIEDENYHLLGQGGVDKSTEIDSTQKAAKGDGRSPLPLLSSTLSDEMSIAYNGKSKIFGVSVKDRAAVSLAGQYGKAFWFSKSTKQFVTSDYYYKAYPSWVEQWNQLKKADKYNQQSWSLMQPVKQYLFAGEKSVGYKTDLAGFGQQFPHPYGEASGKYFGTLLTLSPAGDELTLDFAKTLMAEEKIGQNSVPDYLAISFSSTDYVIHMFGPSSLENEDNLLRLDRTLADLFSHVDKTIGLDKTLIVLSADHGAADAPAYLNQLGAQKPRYFDQMLLEDAGIYKSLKQQFGVGKELVRLYSKPYLYLDHGVINANKLDLNEVQHALASLVEKIPGVEYAVTTEDIIQGKLDDQQVLRLVANNFNKSRSGDIHIVFSPNTYINDFDGLKVASTHGSPWSYDTHVPVIFAGMDIDDEKVTRAVTPYDIAPTIANFLGITQPTGTTGKVLKEVVE
ncbi:alkaline phosphatase [Psychromonas sp. psych-6C06]|uniref:alkaline phosphatase family protein n=1 Tax=Psychromonas sp. psych-6C06 TaxID=2058089 RepID=UPI000C340A09|nr:alkaline phosphatase family protein [Psychromonas sp. psych-6C06]PKF61131.1 alkaline phosphatase [Psychromonas sp. psych-6C06]